MSLLALNATKVNADTSPVAPASLPSDTPSQSANPYEAVGTLSDVGALGYLFDHSPIEWAPAPLEGTSPASEIEVSAETASAGGQTLKDTSTPQPQPGNSSVPAATPSGAWKFSDTLKKEVATFQGRIQQMINKPGESGFNNGGQ